jgi:hypothetical protein
MAIHSRAHGVSHSIERDLPNLVGSTNSNRRGTLSISVWCVEWLYLNCSICCDHDLASCVLE